MNADAELLAALKLTTEFARQVLADRGGLIESLAGPWHGAPDEHVVRAMREQQAIDEADLERLVQRLGQAAGDAPTALTARRVCR